MVLEEISQNLINIADKILKDTERYSQTSEFVKNGRKYKLINNESFERVRENDKFLIVSKDFNDLKENYSLVSSYYILSNIDNVIKNYPELCLSIMGAAREIELNRWFDPDVCVTLPENASYEPYSLKSEALKFASKITKQHINNGLLMMCASKINFFHTDHTASKKIEGLCLRNLVSELFGELALTSNEVYNATRCFSHWGSIKGVLYKLDLKNLWVDYELQIRYRNFPDPPLYFKQSLYDRYPAGTSKYSLCKKSLELIAESDYGKLLTLGELDVNWIFQLCSDIENDPCKYHLRASAKNLSRTPVNLLELPSLNNILTYCAAIMHASNGVVGKKLLLSSKLPKKQIVKNELVYLETKKLNVMLNKHQDLDQIISDIGIDQDKSIYNIVAKELKWL